MQKYLWLVATVAGSLLTQGCLTRWDPSRVVTVEPTPQETVEAHADYKTPKANQLTPAVPETTVPR